MKKLLLSLLCLLLLCGCGQKKTGVDNDIKVVEDVESTSEFDSVYYYYQLNDNEKAYYDLFLNASKNNENSISGSFGFNADAFLTALKAFSYDYPIYYWWGKGVNTTYTDDGFTTKSTESKSDIKDNMDKLIEKGNSIIQECKGEHNYDTIKNIHDYLCANVIYDTEDENGHNIVGSIIDNTCVCDGYALAFKYLTNLAGFNCNIIEGSAINSNKENEEHAWNEIELNNQYYQVDTTWDDVFDPDTLNEKIVYNYFMTSEKIMNIDHTPIDSFKMHDANSNELFYLNMAGEYYETYDEAKLSEDMESWIDKGYTEFFMKFNNYSDGIKAHEYLLENGEFINIYSKFDPNYNISIGGDYAVNSQVLRIYYSDNNAKD